MTDRAKNEQDSGFCNESQAERAQNHPVPIDKKMTIEISKSQIGTMNKSGCSTSGKVTKNEQKWRRFHTI